MNLSNDTDSLIQDYENKFEKGNIILVENIKTRRYIKKLGKKKIETFFIVSMRKENDYHVLTLYTEDGDYFQKFSKKIGDSNINFEYFEF